MRSALAFGMMSAATGVRADGGASVFQHGVASGEPEADSMLLWTRLTGAGEVSGRWRVATDPRMRDVVAQGAFTARAERDFTAKVVVTDLEPGRE